MKPGEDTASAKMPVEADWFEQSKSARVPAQIWLGEDGKSLFASSGKDGRLIRALATDILVSSRIGSMPRTLTFPDGTTLVVRDNDALDRVLAQCGQRRGGILHKTESDYRLLALFIAAAIALSYFAVKSGIPALAESIAWRLPSTILDKPADTLLQELDEEYFRPSALAAERQQEVRALFENVANDLPWERPYRLHMRRMGGSPGIANAFALPNGAIIVTDRLVELVEIDSELIAVIAHEIEHIRQRHVIRSVVSSSILAFGIGMLTGDISGLVTFPVLLAELNYSREQEREADCLAFAYLKRKNMDVSGIGKLLERMEADEGQWEIFAEEQESSEQDDASTSWLGVVLEHVSTHPQTEDRADPEAFCAGYATESAPQPERP